ncbi:MAG: tetraacyldisaccharide 4'-kinase [Bdellovibrionales bacterium]|nr:tetraacyldisaccharide 4'-kinase [Bdellovibrionales bacterium]
MLWLLSKIFHFVTSLRNTLYDIGLLPTYRSPLTVVCIGNVVVGGSGKTPLVQHFIEDFQKQGRRPVVLSRGYKGRLQGPIQVAPGHTAEEVGDEPRMLASLNSVPVVVAKSRVKGARWIESNNLGDVILLDDGYQHRALCRDMNVLTFGIRDGVVLESLEGNRLLPFGLLRESLSQALTRATHIVFHHRGPKLPPELVRRAQKSIGTRSVDFHMWESGGKVTLNGKKIEPQEIIAFCGIARPEGFFESLRSAGFLLAECVVYQDHQKYTEEELTQLKTQRPDRILVCTEKDFVRIPKSWQSHFAVFHPRYVCGSGEL